MANQQGENEFEQTSNMYVCIYKLDSVEDAAKILDTFGVLTSVVLSWNVPSDANQSAVWL